MSPKRIQLLLILGVSAMTLLFTLQLGEALYGYLTHNRRVSAHVYQWETAEIKDKFTVTASYRYTFKEINREGVYTFAPPYYLNEQAAAYAIRDKAKQPQFVWVNAKNPTQSKLERIFPLSLSVRALICYGVLIYFFCLYKRLFSL